MSAEDIDFIRQMYLVSALCTLLFTSMILRGLWRPLRFLLVALAFTLVATPYFYQGDQQRMLPAFVALIVTAKQESLHAAAAQAGMPLMVVFSISAIVALLLAWLLPAPKTAAEKPSRKTRHVQGNPYLPADFQPGAAQPATMSAPPKSQKKNRNPYLPDDFVEY